jgi:Ca2+-transporting ATPase
LLGGVSILLATAVSWQPARTLFHFGRLHWDDLALCAVVGFSSLIVLEALKSRWFRAQAPAAAG